MSEASRPQTASLIAVLIFSTAFVTPFPPYLPLSPSRSSRASNSPVDAPLGAVPLPVCEIYLSFNSWVSSGIQNFTSDYFYDLKIVHDLYLHI